MFTAALASQPQESIAATVLKALFLGLLVPATRAQLSLLATGDWGGTDIPPYVSDVQAANFNAMAGLMADRTISSTPSFGLLLGDNFYPFGVTSARDSRFASTFEEAFFHPQFSGFPFYAILGK